MPFQLWLFMIGGISYYDFMLLRGQNLLGTCIKRESWWTGWAQWWWCYSYLLSEKMRFPWIFHWRSQIWFFSLKTCTSSTTMVEALKISWHFWGWFCWRYADWMPDQVVQWLSHSCWSWDIELHCKSQHCFNPDCKNIEPSQLEHILSLQSLSPLQEEMMSHHCHLHHMPFPKLITMAEKGENPKRPAALKSHCPICVACLFGQVHKCPWWSKSK